MYFFAFIYIVNPVVSGDIYTTFKNFTLPPGPAVTIFNSAGRAALIVVSWDPDGRKQFWMKSAWEALQLILSCVQVTLWLSVTLNVLLQVSQFVRNSLNILKKERKKSETKNVLNSARSQSGNHCPVPTRTNCGGYGQEKCFLEVWNLKNGVCF